MKKKSFSRFFWIFVVLAVIFLFFFMRRNVEGFFTNCRSSPLDVRFCKTCYKTYDTTEKATCTNSYCGCPAGTSTTRPKKPSTGGPVAPKTCPSGYRLVSGSCQLINWSNAT